MLQRYLIVWLTLSSLVALFWSKCALLWSKWLGTAPGTWDPFADSKPLLTLLIIITMYMIGLLMPRREVDNVFRRWPLVFAGAAIQLSLIHI